MALASMTAENVGAVGYLVKVTAEPVEPFTSSPAVILPPEMTPSAIRDALIDEERDEFLEAFHEALAEADRTVDLGKVFDVLRNYHSIAWLTKHQGADVHRRMLDRAAHAQQTGEAPPGSISAAEMRSMLEKRLAR
jgi:hypothetical protein